MLRVLAQTIAELALTVALGFVGLVTLVGTLDEYRAGKAFNKAMDSYAAGERGDVIEQLRKAAAAKSDYAAPLEALGKLDIDQAATDRDPKRYTEAKKLFAELRKGQEAESGKASLAVLVGEAVAELEAVQARNPGEDEMARAVSEARIALDKAGDLYPQSGDLQVNLATLSLMANNLPLAKKHLEQVNAVGSLSIDALPYLYNLNGLIALREGRLEEAVAEFEKTEEFRPGWTVPQLNVAAAYAQSLFRGGLEEARGAHYARSIQAIILKLQRDKHPMLPLLFHALAVYDIRRNNFDGALHQLREAEKYGELSWHGRLNRGVAEYLQGIRQKGDTQRQAPYFERARPVFERALRSERATPRDAFIASAALGTMADREGRLEPAIEHFERAVAVDAKGKDPFIDATRPQLYRSLGAVCYKAGQYAKAREYLDKSKNLPDEHKQAERLLGSLTAKPTIDEFSANLGKVVTDYDVRIGARVAAPASPDPIEAKNVRLTLVNTTSNLKHEVPFYLLGDRIHALLVNVPQGALRIECQVTDSVGNASEVAVKTLRIDREPPRVLERKPKDGETVKALTAVSFRLFDALGSVDIESLTVELRYPRTARTAVRFLVSQGKYGYDAADGSVQKGSTPTTDVRAPVPPDTVSGTYTVVVKARDVEGRLSETEWSFELQ